MCGIFGYIGKQNDASKVIFEGLKRLDYRGYDSWGIAVLQGKSIDINKHVGIIEDANVKDISSNIGIGHTRWATNGSVTKKNAHPHLSQAGHFALAHNGIVENFDKLKKQLIKEGYAFTTETDSEAIAHLIHKELGHVDNITEALRKAFLQLKGRNTVIVLTDDNKVLGARNGSPLVVGINDNIYLSSDTLSFANLAKKVIVVENGQVIEIKDNNIKLIDIKTNKPVKYTLEDVTFTKEHVGKEGFDHYMLKEIFDNPEVIQRTSIYDKKHMQELSEKIKHVKNVYTIGSGTAGLAAAQIAFYLRLYGSIPAVSLIGAEAYEYTSLFSEKDIIIAPSQSGETADVLEILEIAQKKNVTIASHVNMPGSMMSRMAQYKFMSSAGPEISVMSTKALTAQITWGYLLSKTVAGKRQEAIKNIHALSRTIKDYLSNKDNHKKLKKLSKYLSSKQHIFLLSKGQNLAIVKEGMVKIVEGAYKHAHALPAGDLKHYIITLMQKGVPVIVVVSNDEVKSDVITAMNEVKTRGASIIGIAPEELTSFDKYIPIPDTGETAAILNVLPLQLLAYYMAVELGNNVDKPRHIAKSVTVK